MSPEVWAAVASGVVVVTGALVACVRTAWRTARKVGRFLDSWFGHDGQEPIPQRIAALEQGMARLDGRVQRIDAEMRPNGGASMRDAVDRVVRVVAPEDGEER